MSKIATTRETTNKSSYNEDPNQNCSNNVTDDDDDRGAHMMIIVMNSDSGKPIYSNIIDISNDDDNAATTAESNDNHQTSSQIATSCSILHTIQTSSSANAGLGLLQSIQQSKNDKRIIQWMNIPEPPFTFLILTAKSSSRTLDSNSNNNSAMIRIRLEYIYTLFVMTCTDMAFYYNNSVNISNDCDSNMELVCQQNQHFISSLLTCRYSRCCVNNHHRHHSIHPSSILTSGIIPKSIWYHHHDYHRNVRYHISKMLQHHICNTTTTTPNRTASTTTTAPTIIAALLFIDQQYITILQHASTILHGSDLLLIPLFLQRQLLLPSSRSSPNEVWVPCCLPRLHSSGYVHCYATNIHIGDDKKSMSASLPNVVTTLCLISTIGTTDEFHILRNISQRICQSIEMESISDYDTRDSNNHNYHDINDEHDYELIASFSDVSNSLLEAMSNNRINENVGNSNDPHDNKNNCTVSFRSAIRNMIDGGGSIGTESSSWEDWIQQRYLRNTTTDGNNSHNIVVKHFVFRYNVPIMHNDKYIGGQGDNNKNRKHLTVNSQQHHRNGDGEYLAQCICSTYCDDHTNDEATRPEQHSVWVMYHKLQLRLRCGSSNSNDALRHAIERNSSTGIPQSQNDNHKSRDSHTSSSKSTPARKVKQSGTIHRPVPATIDKNCPMIVLSESLPDMDGMTYVTENDSVTYFAMNGNGFELYVATTNQPLFCLFSAPHFSLWCLLLFHKHFFHRTKYH